MPATTTRAGRRPEGRRWRDLRQRKLRATVREHGALYCEKCKRGPLDTSAPRGSEFAVEVNHVVPYALGGDPYPPIDGLTVSCAPCNRGDGRRIQVEKARREGRLVSEQYKPARLPIHEWKRPESPRHALRGTLVVDAHGREVEAPWSPEGFHDAKGRWNPVCMPPTGDSKRPAARSA